MTHQPYDRMSPSGVLWLGHVPSHWTLRRLGYFFDERREKVSDKDYPPLSVTKNGIVPQLDTAAKTDDGDNRKRVARGDFVINSRSDRKGSAGVAELDGSVSLINTVLRPQAEALPRFVHYLLRSSAFQEEFYRYGQGIVADLWTTKYSEMRAILLAMPPLPEQTAIAAFLDRETEKIDALVAEQKRLIELLKEKRQAVISHAVTKGLDPNARIKPSGVEWLGDVPEHWEVHPLKYVASFQSGGTPSKANPNFWDGDVPWVSAKDLKVEVLKDSQDHITDYAIEAGAASLVPSGSIIVLVRGMMLARSFPVVQLAAPMAINQDLKAVVHSDLHLGYLAWVFRGLERECLARTDEAGHGTKALRMEAWSSMTLPKPPAEEQVDIELHLQEVTGRLDDLAASAEAAIDLLLERRSALISAAVTGKIDVRDIVKQKAAA